MELHSRLKALARQVLPRCVLARLDPVEALIESEVLRVSALLREGQVVLDAGAGEARHRKYIKRGRYIALDAGYGEGTWDYSQLDIRGGMESIPLQDSSVDYILCMVALEHSRDPRRVLGEFSRVMKSGGTLILVVPFLWEEHQTPHDYFRFTRYGIQELIASSNFQIDLLCPIGGFFWLCARRSINLLSYFQGSWRWIAFAFLAPFFGLLFPLILYYMDGLDKTKAFSLGFRIRAAKVG
jgi:SAM-dependent methyltransferase